MTDDGGERAAVLRILLHGLNIGWLAKSFYIIQAWAIYRQRPLHVPFFPPVLERVDVAALAWALPPLLGIVALLGPFRRLLVLALWGYFVASGILLIHQMSYNDATFVASFWASFLGVWFASASRTPTELPERLSFLTQALIGLLFLGGVAGKLTPGYLDGSVLYDIYFVDRSYLTFNLLRSWLSPAALPTVARYYSWLVLGIETLLASLPLWPPRIGLPSAGIALICLVLFNNLLLVSVMAPLLALILASLWLLHKATLPNSRHEERAWSA